MLLCDYDQACMEEAFSRIDRVLTRTEEAQDAKREYVAAVKDGVE